MLGDFDATSDAASMSFWRGRRSLNGVSVCYQDAWETARPDEPRLHTFSAENPLVRAGEVATAISPRINYMLIRAGRHGALLQVLAVTAFSISLLEVFGQATTTASLPISPSPSTPPAPRLTSLKGNPDRTLPNSPAGSVKTSASRAR